MDDKVLDEFGLTIPTQEEKDKSVIVKTQMDKLLEDIKTSESTLTHNYVQLGLLLNEIKTHKYWLEWKYPTFGDYIEDLKARIDKGKTQLYHLMSVVENLLPTLTEEELLAIGITKCIELNRYLKASGETQVPEELVDFAKDDNHGVEELRAETFKAINPTEPGYKGVYFDFGGCYLEEEELQEVKSAIELAKSVDPVVKNTLPEHIQRKEVLLRFSREFISSNPEEHDNPSLDFDSIIKD